MKAIPDLDFAAKQIKPNSNPTTSQTPQSGIATTEHRANKPQHKLSGKEGGSRRGSGKMASLTCTIVIKRKICLFKLSTYQNAFPKCSVHSNLKYDVIFKVL